MLKWRGRVGNCSYYCIQIEWGGGGCGCRESFIGENALADR